MPSLSPQVHAQVHGNQTLVMGKDRVFAFDSVYGPEAGQEGIYDEWVAPLVDALFSGYNATVLAYGQTGTGKTFTMGSGDNTGKMAAELGVIPRVLCVCVCGCECGCVGGCGCVWVGVWVSSVGLCLYSFVQACRQA